MSESKHMPENMGRRDFLRLGAAVALNAALFSVGVSGSAFAMTSGEDEELSFLSVKEQMRRFKAGTLSPVDVLEAQIARIRKYNGPLNAGGDEIVNYMDFNGMVNAISYEHFDEARKAARESERRYREGRARALEGITVAIKDENEVRGWKVTMGSLLLKDNVYDEDSALIEKLRDAGAVMHIQTTVPEFYIHIQTWSRLWGVTRNPWNPDYAVGGSSGGSGAALAAGFTTLATGSDMGGSIRIPSSLCGVYGFKPPFGRVPTSEVSFESLGPMARLFEDLVAMQNVISGPHPLVHSALREKLEYPQKYYDLRDVRIALDYCGDWSGMGIDDSVRQAMDDAAAVLRERGAQVEEVELGWKNSEYFEVYSNGLLSSGMGGMLQGLEEYFDLLTPYAANFVRQMKTKKGPKELAEADALTTSLHKDVQKKVFGRGYSALIMPTLVTPYIRADDDPSVPGALINGAKIESMKIAPTYLWNLLSRYPVLDVPIGAGGNNVPIGMQVIGNTYDDLSVFQVGYGYSLSGRQLYRGDLFPGF